MQATFDELQKLQAATQQQAEQLQQQLESTDLALQRAQSLLHATEGDAAELVALRLRVADLETQGRQLEQEVGLTGCC